MERIAKRLNLRELQFTSANKLWEIYDKAIQEFAKELGKDVSQVIEFQSLKEMESMKGCKLCPLYQRKVTEDSDNFK